MEKVVVILVIVLLSRSSWAASECTRTGNLTNTSQLEVLCQPVVINDDFDVGEFGDIDVSKVTSLTVKCRREDGDSYLTNQTFSGLSGLTTLRLERCQISTLPAVFAEMSQLRSLTVTSYNSDVSMVIEGGALDGQQALQHLDLSHNRLWSLPSGLLCPLTGLQSLNLSHNQMEDVADLGLRRPLDVSPVATPCRLPELTVLELSDNRLLTMRKEMWASFPALQVLSVSNNRMEVLQDGALSGLHALQQLDLSANQLVTLPQESFSATRQLVRLQLSNNSLSALTPGMFQGLGRLQLLDLSGNQLTSTWINSHTFSGLVRLVVLDVSRNRLDQLDPSMFSDLYSLQILRLNGNQLDSLSANTFASLTSLHTLVLSHNQLRRLDSPGLNGLHVLGSLALDNNLIDTVEPNAFNNVSSLNELKLNDNRLTEVPKALNTLHMLKSLHLGGNDITSVATGLEAMAQLEVLHLERNMLTNLTRSTLKNMPHLRILNLSRNIIATIAFGTLASNKKLEAVRLDGNRISQIFDLFKDLSELRWLNVSDNRITTFDYNLLPRGVQWLDLHQNRLRQLENSDDVANHMAITMLDASFNRLTSLSGRNLPSSAKILLLNDNQLSHVEQYTFFLMSNLSRVDLFANQLSRLELHALRLNMPNASANTPEFHIGGNPFVCDCSMEWLQRYHEIDRLNHYPRIMDIESIYCRLTYSRERSFVPLVDAEPSTFLCPYQRHCFALCYCCAFDACDCEMTCPDKCTCYHDQAWSSNIVDCSNNGFEEIPSLLPMDATEVYLDGNMFYNLSSLTFLGRKNMHVLYLNGSHIEHIENETFVGLPQLTTLHLGDNNIRRLRGRELVGLDQLRELYLHNNELQYVADDTFAPLSQLEVLRLDGNQLASFSVGELQRNTYLVDVRLSGNQWNCRCDFLKQMRSWLSANVKKVDDVSELVCSFGGNIDAISFPETDETCLALQARSTAPKSVGYLPFVIGALTVLCLFTALVVVIFMYRSQLRVWIYARCGVRVCYRSTVDEEVDRLFDAFVSHSDKDRSFVQDVLVPKLERCEPPYRLALHDRDFAHSAYLADTIVEAVESSRRTIMVLSKNFVENEWCRFQFKSAHHELLKDRRKRLIVILLGDVSIRDLDPDLRLCIKTNTCITWEDKLFWEKLRYALPDVRGRQEALNSASHYSEIDESKYYQRSPATISNAWD